MIGYEEKALCRKIANVFELAGKKGYDVVSITNSWIHSNTALRIYNKDFNEIAQSPVYIFNSFKKEASLSKKNNDEDFNDLLFWLGYMITYIEFYKELSPEEISKKYDILRFAESYAVLQTLSAKRAAEECEEEYKIM